VQGRVFAARRLIAQLSGPPGLLLAACSPTALETRHAGRLGELLGPLFGTGPGAGTGLLVVLAGLLGICAGAVGYAIRAIRRVDDLPDRNRASPEPTSRATKKGFMRPQPPVLPDFIKQRPPPHRDYLSILLAGLAMGAPDVVPGVSGGTIAFIVGIYEELLGSIRMVGGPWSGGRCSSCVERPFA
jgi:hypothetical protein